MLTNWCESWLLRRQYGNPYDAPPRLSARGQANGGQLGGAAEVVGDDQNWRHAGRSIAPTL
jgi:hypothetical protein